MRSAESNLKCSMINSTRKRTIIKCFFDSGPILRVLRIYWTFAANIIYCTEEMRSNLNCFAPSTLRVSADKSTSPLFSKALTTVSSSLDYQPIVLLQFPEKDHNCGCRTTKRITWANTWSMSLPEEHYVFPSKDCLRKNQLLTERHLPERKDEYPPRWYFFFLQSSKTVQSKFETLLEAHSVKGCWFNSGGFQKLKKLKF